MDKKEFEEIVKSSVSKSEVCRKIGLFANGTGMKKIDGFAKEYGVSLAHFSQAASNNKFNRKYVLIQKVCPVCGKPFETRKDHSREKQTCSYSCSNTLFRSGENNPNYKGFDVKHDQQYRRICFDKNEKKCFICGFECVVTVHHIDGDHYNNDPENLIPLCPNHHQMYHTKKYKEEIVKLIEEKLRVVA